MTVQSFCELFVAGCLEVRYQEEPPWRLYRAIEGLDVTLLSGAEQAVARCLGSFKSFRALLEETGTGIPQARQELLEQCAGILDEALEYAPPTSSCSV